MGTEWKITSDRPIYLQLTEQIVQRIVSGCRRSGSWR